MSAGNEDGLEAPSVNGGGAGNLAARTAANSGNDESGRHSVPPCAWASVWPLARPSRIQALIWSAVTGPYSFRSPPMILYMPHSFDRPQVHSFPGRGLLG